MPTTRRRVTRTRRPADLPAPVTWWLQHGRMPGHDEIAGLGFDDARHAGWQLLVLDADMFWWSSATMWTRGRLREAGFGPQIDALIAKRRTEPDRRRAGEPVREPMPEDV